MYARRSFVLLTFTCIRGVLLVILEVTHMQDITQVKMIRSSDHVKQ